MFVFSKNLDKQAIMHEKVLHELVGSMHDIVKPIFH